MNNAGFREAITTQAFGLQRLGAPTLALYFFGESDLWVDQCGLMW
jgi:hypothetical protein